MSLEMDKCTEQFTFRIPEILKHDYEKLTRSQKSDMIEELIITIARGIHKANFDPEVYLKSENSI